MTFIRRVFHAIGRFVRYLTTARDNETPSLIRVFALGTGLQFVWLAGYSIIIGKAPFDPLAYGGGVSAMLVALATALRVALPANAGNDKPASNLREGDPQ